MPEPIVSAVAGGALYPMQAQALCGFPERLHPVSRTILDNFLDGALLAPEFLRFFSLPNSAYIPLARCFLDLLYGSPAI